METVENAAVTKTMEIVLENEPVAEKIVEDIPNEETNLDTKKIE